MTEEKKVEQKEVILKIDGVSYVYGALANQSASPCASCALAEMCLDGDAVKDEYLFYFCGATDELLFDETGIKANFRLMEDRK